MATTLPSGQGVRVGIVGGSIAGCAVAIQLSRAGFAVSVFERSRGELVGRGAGIGTPMATFHSLIERDLLDADVPYCHNTKRPLIGRASADDRYGHTATDLPWNSAMMHWGELYRNLRRRVPDNIYHQGCTVTNAQMVDDHTVEVCFDDASTQVFDLVIFADGYQSLGRRLLFPEVGVEYRGYVAWRGSMDERHLSETEPLESASTRVCYQGMAGHLVTMLVPGRRGSVAKGNRYVHWVAYLPVSSEALPHFLTDRDGRQHLHSLPPGGMRPDEEERLKALVRPHLPPYYADIITASHDTFVQPIYTVDLPAYHRGRICLIGDAGAVASPITRSGVFKGMTNATDLVATLRTERDLDRALAAWDEEQTRIGQHHTALSEQIEQALMWATPDLSELDAASAEEWYYRTVPLQRP